MNLVRIDLTEREVEAYYNGFCNRTLWPMFHCFQARIRVDQEEEETYFEVNKKFSRVLRRFLEPEDIVWVHDYHLMPLGHFIRKEGFEGPLGFFLHTPFPPVEMIEILPNPQSFMEACLYYDLAGFHTERYRENYFEVMARLLPARREGDTILSGDRQQRVVTVPIGIDPSTFRHERGKEIPEGKRPYFSLHGSKVVFAVDRLDYSKGIPERMMSFEYFLKRYPRWRTKVSLVQVCSPSRTRVREYREQKELVDSLVGRINGEYSEHDWHPVRYLYRTYEQSQLAHFYRNADVALVTPLRDGMNLVAMEYVAAQRPENPGVLVLSKYAGAAEYLKEAIHVNPYLPESMAEALDKALAMPLAERRYRHQAMMKFIDENTSQRWADQFISSLISTHKDTTQTSGHLSDVSRLSWKKEMA